MEGLINRQTYFEPSLLVKGGREIFVKTDPPNDEGISRTVPKTTIVGTLFPNGRIDWDPDALNILGITENQVRGDVLVLLQESSDTPQT